MDAIFVDGIRAAGLYDETVAGIRRADCRCARWGSWATSRTYDETVSVLRAVTSLDAMTADWARLPYDVLATDLQRESSTEVEGVNRVVYDITSKPPGTIEWE